MFRWVSERAYLYGNIRDIEWRGGWWIRSLIMWPMDMNWYTSLQEYRDYKSILRFLYEIVVGYIADTGRSCMISRKSRVERKRTNQLLECWFADRIFFRIIYYGQINPSIWCVGWKERGAGFRGWTCLWEISI